jgi:hypothetical protein
MKPRPLAVRPEKLPAIRRAFCRELRSELVGKRLEVSKSWRDFACSLGQQGAVLLMGSSASPAPKRGYPTRPAPSGGLPNTPASGRGWLFSGHYRANIKAGCSEIEAARYSVEQWKAIDKKLGLVIPKSSYRPDNLT